MSVHLLLFTCDNWSLFLLFIRRYIFIYINLVASNGEMIIKCYGKNQLLAVFLHGGIKTPTRWFSCGSGPPEYEEVRIMDQ